MSGNKQQYLIDLFTEKFSPYYLDVVNESHLHVSNKGENSHFKLIIVTDKFKNMPLIQRHRLIYQLLESELATEIHALALHLYTVNEWKQTNTQAPSSPKCGGIGK